MQFSEVAAATTNMTDLSRHEYDWRLRLSHINMTDSDLTKYDWRGDLVTAAPGTIRVTCDVGYLYRITTSHHVSLVLCIFTRMTGDLYSATH